MVSFVMVLMRADPLRGQVGGGWALEIEIFLDHEMATSEASAIIWAPKSHSAVNYYHRTEPHPPPTSHTA
jgi:hypothetical protein